MFGFLCFRRIPNFQNTVNGLPIKRGLCSATIGDRFYNFNALGKDRPVIKTHNDYDGLDYYISFCRPLVQQDVPPYANVDFDTYVISCNASSSNCQDIVYGTDFDFKPENESNLDSGIIWTADGIPRRDERIVDYDLFDITHNFHCNPAATGKDIQPTTILWSNSGDKYQLFIEWDTSYGCATPIANPPEPTPTYDCRFTNRIAEGELPGIDIDLETLNNGPIGIRSYFVDKSSEQWVLYYTPCGASQCPYSATCDEDTSSVWVCNMSSDGQKIEFCKSYGVINGDEPDVELNGAEYSGIVHTLENPLKNRQSKILYACSNEFPKGYLEGRVDPDMFTDEHLMIRMGSADVCVHDVPLPVPTLGQCRAHMETPNAEGNIWTLDVDLSEFNQQGGNDLEVTITNRMPTSKRRLIIQPCGSTICPAGYSCNGDEDAEVWLCDIDAGYRQTKQCEGYGLAKYNLSVSLIDGYIMNGLDVVYRGDSRRSAQLALSCDDGLAGGQFVLDEEVEIKSNVLYLSGRSGDVCARGSGSKPTPPPVVRPDKPTHGPTPTPTPNPRPNNDLFAHNETHFIYIDLERVDKTLYRGSQTLGIQAKFGKLYSEFSAWDQIPCPHGYTCEAPEANMWSCWTLEDGKPFCHNSGDIYMRTALSADRALDKGVIVHYEGWYGTGADIRLECRQNSNRSSISNLNNYVTFHRGSSGSEFEYSTTTELACPTEFLAPTIPQTTPTPTPDPKYRAPTSFDADVAGKRVSVNLKKMPSVDLIPLFVGQGNSFHAMRLKYSPVAQVGCPGGYDCGIWKDTKANAWKCYEAGGGRCYPIGDSRYGLRISMQNESDPEGGVVIAYDGGVGSDTATFIHFCNRSAKGLEFHEVAHSYGSMDHTIFEVETPLVCPVESSEGISGGAIFLIIVICGPILYVAVGTLIIFLTTGSASLPQAAFWSEFGACVVTGAVFIFTCGKRTQVSSATYDTI